MTNFIIIIYPTIRNAQDFEKLDDVLNSLKEITSWTIDRDDCDYVLRIEANQNIEDLIQKSFLTNNINSSVMAVFNPIAQCIA